MNEYIKEIIERWGISTDTHVVTAIIVLMSVITMCAVFWFILHIVSPKASHFREMCFKVIICTTAVLLVITTFVSIGGNVVIKETDSAEAHATYIGTINAPLDYDDYGVTIGFSGYNNIEIGKSDVVILEVDGATYAYTPYREGNTWYLNYAGNAPFRTTMIEDGNILKFDYITLWAYYRDNSINVYTMSLNSIRGVLDRGGV